MTQMIEERASKAGWINAVLIPVKQHAFCCVLLPPLITALFGANAGEVLYTLPGEIALSAVVPPVITYGTMSAEQAIHKWKDNRQGCTCTHKTLTQKNYLKQTALSYFYYAAAAVATHAIWPHNHTYSQQTPYHGQHILHKIEQRHHHKY